MSLVYPYRRPASRVGDAGDGDDCPGSNSLGPRMEAPGGQLIRAERLATLALVATKTAALIEPRVERIGAAVGRVHERLDVTGEEARTAAAEIATASAKILGRAAGSIGPSKPPSPRAASSGRHAGSAADRRQSVSPLRHLMSASVQ